MVHNFFKVFGAFFALSAILSFNFCATFFEFLTEFVGLKSMTANRFDLILSFLPPLLLSPPSLSLPLPSQLDHKSTVSTATSRFVLLLNDISFCAFNPEQTGHVPNRFSCSCLTRSNVLVFASFCT
jgi:hypothetical protein